MPASLPPLMASYPDPYLQTKPPPPPSYPRVLPCLGLCPFPAGLLPPHPLSRSVPPFEVLHRSRRLRYSACSAHTSLLQVFEAPSLAGAFIASPTVALSPWVSCLFEGLAGISPMALHVENAIGEADELYQRRRSFSLTLFLLTLLVACVLSTLEPCAPRRV